ncbi:hypothetical protein [Haloarchaeobius sp. FL176]|uniref:hypothetical protein n=1 Tax=Haloarchaeobius sp. FL176 TaxID=2967129 RepID=UPI0021477264|nr:hypothetical protein [Haloarchaeobius sp. FL176]
MPSLHRTINEERRERVVEFVATHYEDTEHVDRRLDLSSGLAKYETGTVEKGSAGSRA